MNHNYFSSLSCKAGRRWAAAGLLLMSWLLAFATWAQAPVWSLATVCGAVSGSGASSVRGVAADASGNVLVVGSFTGQVAFGTTTLTSLGSKDLFVAKYVPATATWAWALRGGGTDNDVGYGIAVRGTSVYVTGTSSNTSLNTANVSFESGGAGAGTVLVPVRGCATRISGDLVLAKYTDNGPSATLGWVQTGGGFGNDFGTAVAVSGTAVYVSGMISNDLTNGNAVVFGGTATTAGSAPQAGAANSALYDVVLAKYTDNGPTATLGWTQTAGGTDFDYAYDVAVSGSSVYVTGSLINDRANSKAVVFGGAGTTFGTIPQYGASSMANNDLFVAKYTDNGPTATLRWVQVGGGTSPDEGFGIAVNGSSVYVTGYINNNTANLMNVAFGGTGTAAGTATQLGATALNANNIILAKYTDNGASATLGWTQVAGGPGFAIGTDLVVNGPNVYVTGYASASTAPGTGLTFGGTGTTVGTTTQPGASATTSYDIVVANYTDNGPTATLGWTQAVGGAGDDFSGGLAVNGTSIYLTGQVVPVATFGSLSIAVPTGTLTSVLASFTGAILATTPTGPVAATHLFPNPAPGPATLSGAAPRTAVQILNALGRCVATTLVDASGVAALPAGLAPGLYLVRAGAATVRWVVE